MRITAHIRLLIAVALLGAVLWLAFAATRRLPETRETGVVSLPENSADLAMKGVRFTETAEGSTRWILVAETAAYDRSSSTVALTAVSLTATPADKKLGEVLLTSPRASYNTDSRVVFLSGGVTARSGTGMEFTTSAAQFSGQTGMVTTAHPVSFSDASLSVQGTGMEFNVSTYKLRIHSDVRTVYKGGAER